MFEQLTESQWPYFKFWLFSLLAAESIMLILNGMLFEIYIIIAVLFLCGFLLRIFHLYPGQKEPLILDLSAVIMAVLYSLLAERVGESLWRFLLILSSSLIIFPHLVYIAREK